jgi:hypothetical protein
LESRINPNPETPDSHKAPAQQAQSRKLSLFQLDKIEQLSLK